MRLENHLMSILESLHDAVIVILMDETIVYINKAYTEQFNVPAEKIIGRKMGKIEKDSKILEVLKNRKALINNCSYVQSLGKNVCANITPLMENGEMIGVVTIMKDISEVTTLEKEIVKYQRSITQLKEKVENHAFMKLQSKSLEMQQTVALTKKVADSNATIILHGESGVGKEVFAHAVHEASSRQNKAFTAINMASIPETLFESELFGYEEGSFTGSRKGGKRGLLEIANKGTLFLDEIGEMSLNMQTKLLRVIQERQYQKVGGTKLHNLDVRIICATHRDLKQMMLQGKFREDLYYRLNVVPIHIPPLRDRKEDLEFLSQNILNDLCIKYGKHVWIDEEVMEWMKSYTWPGNVRELANMLERMIAVSTRSYLSLHDLPEHVKTIESNQQEYTPAPIRFSANCDDLPPLKTIEKEYIHYVVSKCKNKTDAIRKLGISRKAFYAKYKKYNLK